jgi:protein TonB
MIIMSMVAGTIDGEPAIAEVLSMRSRPGGAAALNGPLGRAGMMRTKRTLADRERRTHWLAAASTVLLHLAVAVGVLGGWARMPVPAKVAEETVRVQLNLLPPAAPAMPVAQLQAPAPTPDSTASPPRSSAALAPPTSERPLAEAMPAAAQFPDVVAEAIPEPPSSPASPDDAAERSQQASPPAPSLPPAPRHAGRMQANWTGEVLARLERFRRYPRAAQVARQQGVAYVHVRIDRQGRVLSAALQRSSGHALLDEEALQTFHRAQPLPAPPASLPDPVELEVPVEFFLR